MPISKDQLERRRRRIGSSDSPPIVGIPIATRKGTRTAYDVFLEKTQDIADQADNEAIEIGNDYEEPLLRWAARELGVEIRPNVEALHPTIEIMAANHDALIVGKPQGMEAKTGTGADYGDPETDQVPERVIVQCQHQMAVSELELVWVPVLVAKFDRLSREMYRVTRNEKLISLIEDRDVAFWHNHVLPRIPPADLLPSLGVLQRVRRIPDKLALVDPELVVYWRSCREQRDLSKAAYEDAAAALVAALDDAEGADFGDPKKVLTYRGYSYDQVDGKRLKVEDPATWERFKREIVVSPSLREVSRK
jgi:YqaJ-like viral recombinase domain